MNTRDPEAMTESERRAEIAEILAVAYRRLRQVETNHLAASDGVVAPCAANS